MGRPLKYSKVVFICVECGKEKESYYNPNQTYKFCSQECRYKHKKKETCVKICKNCKNNFTVNKVIENRFVFCNKRCKLLYYGNVNNQRRGGSWEHRRRKALYRDNYKCRLCGNLAETVHHIIPFRNFKSGKEANRLENIISLCNACHRLTFSKELEFADLFFRILRGENNDR